VAPHTIYDTAHAAFGIDERKIFVVGAD
jgi:hypothetical protein